MGAGPRGGALGDSPAPQAPVPWEPISAVLPWEGQGCGRVAPGVPAHAVCLKPACGVKGPRQCAWGVLPAGWRLGGEGGGDPGVRWAALERRWWAIEGTVRRAGEAGSVSRAG